MRRVATGPLKRPLMLGFALGEAVLEIALTVVREARAALGEEPASQAGPQEASAATPPPTARVRRSRPAPSPTRRRGAASPSAAAPAAPPPVSPTIAEKAKTIQDDPVRVAEFGEEGAEQDAGAEVSVAEPWDGYSSMTAAKVRRRLEEADRAALAAVVLYESFAKRRSSVIEFAERRLRLLSAPSS